MSFAELSRERFSVRKFKELPVDRSLIEQILETGRIAPTAANRQPQRILVAETAEQLEKIDAATKCRFGAPLVFLVCYDSAACWVRPFDKQDSGFVDASIVTTHMMLQAQELGLGTTWVMFFEPDKVREVFELPERIIPAAMLICGHPDPGAVPAPGHSERLPLDKILL